MTGNRSRPSREAILTPGNAEKLTFTSSRTIAAYRAAPANEVKNSRETNGARKPISLPLPCITTKLSIT
jgi:hypothetical protein